MDDARLKFEISTVLAKEVNVPSFPFWPFCGIDCLSYEVTGKRCKVDNDSATYLWHCRLGHIGVKRMKKLHADGLLESIDYESFDTCEPSLQKKDTLP